jgi:hypothetical protein
MTRHLGGISGGKRIRDTKKKCKLQLAKISFHRLGAFHRWDALKPLKLQPILIKLIIESENNPPLIPLTSSNFPDSLIQKKNFHSNVFNVTFPCLEAKPMSGLAYLNCKESRWIQNSLACHHVALFFGIISTRLVASTWKHFLVLIWPDF